ncbi:hypothetical protein CC86DRAFT_410635 [Ophiobolus disseminans]|uniref:Uncharacterized protein n=1 Tax=Ophiobolus disseminans TaxID=1469910 RepID=A0A6A6ZNA4_9PLEO|nr:hypothetical protein CC86DRAFT_410635 [Ophiobolus disseminans]
MPPKKGKGTIAPEQVNKKEIEKIKAQVPRIADDQTATNTYLATFKPEKQFHATRVFKEENDRLAQVAAQVQAQAQAQAQAQTQAQAQAESQEKIPSINRPGTGWQRDRDFVKKYGSIFPRKRQPRWYPSPDRQ